MYKCGGSEEELALKMMEERKVAIRERGIVCLDVGAKGRTSTEEGAFPRGTSPKNCSVTPWSTALHT